MFAAMSAALAGNRVSSLESLVAVLDFAEIKSKAFSNSFPGEPPIFITEMIHASAG